MLHPKQFEVNEAWLVFRLNNKPIRTERDGDFNCIALMDAASCFILGSELTPVDSVEIPQEIFHSLLKHAEHHTTQLPRTLFIPSEEMADLITRRANELNIDVVQVSENELLIFTGEARDGFAEQFEGASDEP